MTFHRLEAKSQGKKLFQDDDQQDNDQKDFQDPSRKPSPKMGSLRCNLCLEVFTAANPEDFGEEKYDEVVLHGA